MKLSIAMEGQTTTIEVDKEGLTVDEVMDLFCGLLVASGFAQESVDRLFVE